MKYVVYDENAALERAGGNLDRARRFLEMLLASFPEFESALCDALDRSDHESLRDHAHRLAGAASYCGAQALREAANRLEAQAAAGGADRIALSTSELVDQIDRFRLIASKPKAP